MKRRKKSKLNREDKLNEELMFLIKALEIKLERTNNRIRIAESTNMNTFRFRISAKIDLFIINLCYIALYNPMFVTNIDDDI